MASASEALVLIAAAALFAAHALTAVCNAFSSEWRRETRKALAKVRQCFVILCPWRRGVADELSSEVAARMRERQLRQFRSILTGLKWCYCIGTAIHIIHLDKGSFASLQQDVLVMIAYCMTLLADCCPWLLTESSMDIWYSCNSVLWTLYIIPTWCAYDVMDNSSVFIRMAIAFVNLARLNIPMALFWTVARLLCVCWSVAVSEHRFSGPGSDVLRYEVIFTIGMILLVGVFSAHMEAGCRRDAEEQATEDKQAALDALLEMTYDVVVDLDRDFRIASPAPRLSGFLLRQSTSAMQNLPFEDLLFEEADRELFRTQVCAALDTVSSKTMVQLRMVDGNGTAMSVELFSFRSHRLGRHPRCILGVREYGDTTQRNRLLAQGEAPISGVDQVCELEEVVAVVDAMDTQLPILECSPAFTVKVMPMTRGFCFVPALVGGNSFVDWLQTMAQKQWYSGEVEDDAEDEERPRESFSLQFRPRGRTYMQAFCSAALVPEASPDNAEAMPASLRMQLTLSHLTEMPLGQLRGSLNSSSNSSSSSRSSRSFHGTPGASPRRALQHRAEAGGPHAGRGPAGAAICSRPLSL